MQGEGEVKVFSALRARHKQAPNGSHIIVCCDTDAVVMALMAPLAIDLTIAHENGDYMRMQDLRREWVLQPMRQAGVCPWSKAPSHPDQKDRRARTPQDDTPPSPPPAQPKTPRMPGDEFPDEQVEAVQRVCILHNCLDRFTPFLQLRSVQLEFPFTLMLRSETGPA